MATPSAKAPVLNGPEDWHDWLDYLKDLSTSKRVWQFVDPSLAAVPAIVEPTIPSIADVSDVADATIMTISDQERSALSILQRTYAMQYTQWQAKEAALQHVNDRIKATTGQHYQAYITGIATPYERLKELKSRVAPADATRTLQVRQAYRSSLTELRRTAWETWLHNWEKAFKDGEKLKIAEVNGDLPVYDFLDAVSSTNAHFAEFWRLTCNNKKNSGTSLPSVRDIAKEWRDHMRSQNIGGNAFNTTLQGQGPNDSAEAPEGNPPRPPCVCGMEHPYAHCPYLFPDLRPDGWKPNPEVEKQIQATIATNTGVRRGVKAAKRRHLAQSAPSASPASPATTSSASPAPSSDSPVGIAGASFKTHGLVA